MIKFKNITGDSFLAVGTIQRKFALNGEKSLSGVLYDGDDVLNSIDKGWSLEFDGEPYVVTYFERNDNDNTLSFDAVHKFFWNMSKSVLYSETSGSHTISWYLDQIFANTGYTYALNFKPKAVSKDNWGMKTKLALFNDIISSISGEFEINGTLISIFEKVGSDLSTIVRYGFNLSDMSIENDAVGFVTYGEGFGAYEDQQNQSGPRLHTTYTSPLASVYGILQAEPVDDQRYTIERNLKDAIKAKIDASFSVSIKLSLYDLTAAGYPYKMAHVGDWLMAIDERLNFKQRIRIISVDDEFDVNGNRISYTVTAGNVGVVQKYQEANASLATQVNNALESANNALDNANIALISASGKNTSYYVDSFDMLPTTANEGDLGWVQAGDGRVLYIYTKKPDGTFYWEKRIDPEMQEQIETSVDKVVSDAKEYSDKLVADNAEQVNRVLSDVQDKQVELKNEQIELDRKAQGYADKALADAKADTATVAQQVAQNAQVALNDAETTLRQEINQKVSQADYDEKTGDLTAKVSTAQQTAEQANATIGNYRRSNDGRVSAAESAIQQNANAITSKVSQTAYDAKTGELSGQISTINQKANEITQSVASVRTKVDGMKIGGRNYIKNSDMVTINNNTYMGDLISTLTTSTFSNQSLVLSVQLDYDNITELTGNKRLGAEVLFINNETGANIWFGTWVYPKVGDSFHGRVYNVIKLPDVRDNANNSFRDGMYVQGITGTNVRVSKPKLEIGTMPTDFSAAPENTEQKISTINQTVDSISNVVSNPTTGLSKRVQTAEGALSQVQGTDLPVLQRATFWQPYGSLDFNTYTKQGSFFFNTTAAKTNGPTTSTAWIYLVVEQGWSDSSRVTQTTWYDQQGIKTTYRRSLNSGTWTPWYANDNDSVSSIKQTNDAIQSEITNRQTGDTNTLTQAKDFTTSSITRYDLGMQSQLTQTSDSIIAQVSATGIRYIRVNGQGSNVNNGTHFIRISLFDSSGTDLLFGKSATLSGPGGPRFPNTNVPNMATDGDINTFGYFWPEPNLNNFMVYDLGAITYTPQRIEIKVLATGKYKGVTVQVSPDNKTWRTVFLGDVQGLGNGDINIPDTTINLGSMSSATVLALLKDNWSIGIADNAGKLASGVFGDINGMSLNGKTVTINANQTVITGTAWINSAMVGAGQIGTVQIGDAAITNAKIASLDVDKITGNISNWVLSQWTSATGNKVTIDGNGMYFSPGASRMTRHGFEAWRPDSNAGGGYAAMGMLGSYAWETNSNINGVGLFAKFNGVPHDDPGSPYRGEIWGGDTIAIGAVQPQSNHGYGYIEPYMIFPANNEVGNMYRPGNNSDTLILSRWLSIYTGLNMRGNSIVNSSGYSLKENFKPVSGKESLDIFDNTDIMSYDYKHDSEEMDERTEANRKDKVGFVINDNGQSPFKTDQRLVRYGNTRDDSVTVGYLMAAVKELNAQIKELKSQQGK